MATRPYEALCLAVLGRKYSKLADMMLAKAIVMCAINNISNILGKNRVKGNQHTPGS
jgi:hypothetical protein